VRISQAALEVGVGGQKIFAPKICYNGYLGAKPFVFQGPKQSHLRLAKLLELTHVNRESALALVWERRRNGVVVGRAIEEMRYGSLPEQNFATVKLFVEDRELHP
jgi:hypothetical protein